MNNDNKLTIPMEKKNHVPLVSVVLCTYNGERYIGETIASVLGQTFTDFEFIIWNDGSTDGTEEIIKGYSDERIRLFSDMNRGLGMALRLACAEAKGKYIARIDADDVCLPERFAREVAFLERHEEYVLVSSAVYYIDADGKGVGRSFPCSDDWVLRRVILKSSGMIAHPMVMMRRDAYLRAGGYLSIRKSQDLLFWSRLARQGKFYNISEPLGRYRLLETSLCHALNPQYLPIISAFLRKMVLDEVVVDADVRAYNLLYQYSKRYVQQSEPAKPKELEAWKNAECRLFSVLRRMMGDRRAERLIVALKNFYYRIRLA